MVLLVLAMDFVSDLISVLSSDLVSDLVVVSLSVASEVEGIGVGLFSVVLLVSAKKNGVGVGVGDIESFSVVSCDGLTVSGLTIFILSLFLLYQARTPARGSNIIINGKSLSVFCFMRGIIASNRQFVKSYRVDILWT